MTTQPIHNKKQHPPTPIGTLLNRYAISLEMVKQCLVEEGVRFSSRSTLHRLVHGRISQEMQAEIYPKLSRCLSKFLIARGLAKAEVDAHMLSIFTEGEYQPMISQRLELTAAELQWFNLPKDPFSGFPQSKDEVYVSPGLRAVIDRVIDAIKYPDFICVVEEIGSGKTVLRAMVEDYVAGQQNVHIIWPEFFDMGKITPIQIARAILTHFGIVKIPQNAQALGTAVKRCLEREFKGGNRICLGFDECHRLNDAAISALKNFFEMGSGGFQRWLSVLLFGQPVFKARLSDDKFREIYERVVPVQMPPFTDHAAEYLAFRLKTHGAPADLFDQEAVDLICQQATTPLSLGNIANAALRLSKDEFQEKTVIGAAIKTKMFFEARRETQGFAKRV